MVLKQRAYIQPSAHLEKSVHLPLSGLQKIQTYSNNAVWNTKFSKTVWWSFSVYTTFLLNILNSAKSSVTEFHVNFWREVSLEQWYGCDKPRLLWKEGWSMTNKTWEFISKNLRKMADWVTAMPAASQDRTKITNI